MILLSIDTVTPFINSYYLTYRQNSELLGFMPCSQVDNNHAAYYSVATTKGVRVAPVFYVPNMIFDSEGDHAVAGPALFFRGCDDGHMGIKFETKADALQWLDACPYNDFEFLVQAYDRYANCGKNKFKFEWHN